MLFPEFDLDESLLRGVADMGFVEPTPIQEDAIPPGLEGRDVLGAAMTGSGKTAAYLLPILHQLLALERGTTRALVVTPTRELAAQVEEHMQALAAHTDLTAVVIHGGVAYEPQERAFRQGVDVIIATPGRLLDHLRRPYAKLDQVCFLVLDEADRMLDMGFIPDVRRILSRLPKKRQTALFSATMPGPIVALSRELLVEPATINIERKAAPATGITQVSYPVREDLKPALFLHLLETSGIDNALAFVRTRERAERFSSYLSKHGISVTAIHGDRTQTHRTRALEDFKQGKYRVLVATDVAARGLDLVDLTHVVNLDVPNQPEDYIHRIGRTARYESTGDALTFFGARELADLHLIEKVLGIKLPRMRAEGFDYGSGSRRVTAGAPSPRPVAALLSGGVTTAPMAAAGDGEPAAPEAPEAPAAPDEPEATVAPEAPAEPAAPEVPAASPRPAPKSRPRQAPEAPPAASPPRARRETGRSRRPAAAGGLAAVVERFSARRSERGSDRLIVGMPEEVTAATATAEPPSRPAARSPEPAERQERQRRPQRPSRPQRPERSEGSARDGGDRGRRPAAAEPATRQAPAKPERKPARAAEPARKPQPPAAKPAAKPPAKRAAKPPAKRVAKPVRERAGSPWPWWERPVEDDLREVSDEPAELEEIAALDDDEAEDFDRDEAVEVAADAADDTEATEDQAADEAADEAPGDRRRERRPPARGPARQSPEGRAPAGEPRRRPAASPAGDQEPLVARFASRRDDRGADRLTGAMPPGVSPEPSERAVAERGAAGGERQQRAGDESPPRGREAAGRGKPQEPTRDEPRRRGRAAAGQGPDEAPVEEVVRRFAALRERRADNERLAGATPPPRRRGRG